MSPPPPTRPAARRAVGAVAILASLFFIAVAAVVGFYAGIRYRSGDDALKTNVVVEKPPVVVATPAASEIFEARKKEIDRAPFNESVKMSELLTADPNNGNDPEFLYLYGRSLMRSGEDPKAAAQFEMAVGKIKERMMFSEKMPLLVDSYAAAIAAHVGANDFDNARRVSQEFKQWVNTPAAAEASATPEASPTPQQ